MSLLFIIVLAVYFIAFGSRIITDIKQHGWVQQGLQARRLRRRGRAAYSGKSMSLTLSLFIPKLLCAIGHHGYTEQQKYLKRLEPGHELTCERWFCKEFTNGRQRHA